MSCEFVLVLYDIYFGTLTCPMSMEVVHLSLCLFVSTTIEPYLAIFKKTPNYQAE